MTYTHAQHIPGVHITRIEPLDAAIVRFALTVRVQGYPETVSEELLSLYASLALTKTKTKNKEALEMYLKKYGMHLKVSSRRTSVTFKGSVRSEHTEQMVKLLREILLTHSVDATEFALKKKLIIEDNREARDDAKRIASIAFSNLLYDRTSVMRDPTLDEELKKMRAIQKSDVEACIASFPRNEWYLTVVGTKETEKKFEPLVRSFKSKASEVQYPVLETRLRDSMASFTTVPGKTNVEVRIGNIVPITPEHDAFIPLEVGIAILGKVGSFSGRLMSTVRDKEGLTYGIYARLTGSDKRSTIHWSVFSFFTAQDLKKGLDSTRREIARIVHDGVTDRELAIFKEILSNQMILHHESNATRLSYYHDLALTGYSEKDAHTIHEKIMQLRVEDVNSALKTYIDPEKLIIVGAGPVNADGTPITK